jgi:hypothetical protein
MIEGFTKLADGLIERRRARQQIRCCGRGSGFGGVQENLR